MANLAIKGHAALGNEVVEILEMLGGKNVADYNGTSIRSYYFLNDNIICSSYDSVKAPSIDYYTLEEFLEKFPYRVGDKVKIAETGKIVSIEDMSWKNERGEVVYETCYNNDCVAFYSAIELQPYKEEPEETMEDIIKIDIPKGYEFAGVDDDEQKVVFTKILSKYPKTYEECCEVLGIGSYFEPEVRNATTEECHKFINLIKLKRCRDAYWKLYGDKAGLGKPWEPDWNDGDEEKYCIEVRNDNELCDITYLHAHRILAFPTMELLDIFGEYFKDLIEECKELL